MFLLKLFPPTIVLIAALLQIGLMSRWRDRRTRGHNRRLRWFVIFMIIAALSTCAVVITDQYESNKREQAAIDRNRGLEAQLRFLHQNLQPFVDLASRQYPALDVGVALAKLADDVRAQQKQLEIIRDYTEVAKLNFAGTSGTAVLPLAEQTPISRMLDGALTITDGRSQYKCDPASIQQYETVSTQSPRFPFAYYALAFCLSQSGDATWKQYAVRAIEILNRTTTIDGHHPDHDQALHELEEALRQ